MPARRFTACGFVKILLVEDSERLQAALCTTFRAEGHVVDASRDGEEGLWYALNHTYDVIVLDIMLPGRDGISVLEFLRSSGSATPVLLLTARSSVPDRVNGLRVGADDYLIKPFAVEELLERIYALARRNAHTAAEALRVGSLTVDTRLRQARLNGQALALTPKEYRLLELLCRRCGEVLNRTEIEENIYDSLTEPSSNVVDVTVASLRRKMRDAGAPMMVQTRRGHGYFIEGTP
jgi:two-component system copper resistance phosphate regulon response regulator CusR